VVIPPVSSASLAAIRSSHVMRRFSHAVRAVREGLTELLGFTYSSFSDAWRERGLQ
jgi:hypothetical protein